MEGHYYTKKFIDRQADVPTLGDVERFSHIVSVYPIYIEIGDQQVSDDEIKQAVAERRAETDRKSSDLTNAIAALRKEFGESLTK